MSISSKSLFHFTTRLEVLKLILTTGFRYSPCSEELPQEGFSQHVDSFLHLVRVVCFCDIPLSQSVAHRTQYGRHGIAMSKDWGLRMGVTPIRYLHKRSPDMRAHFLRRFYEIRDGLASCPEGIFEFYSKYLEEIGYEDPPSFEVDIRGAKAGMRKLLDLIVDDYQEIFGAYSRLISLSRLYEGEWKDRETQLTTSRCFYDEREWRAVSLHETPDNLQFTFADINYLIVNDAREQEDLVHFILNNDLNMLEVPKQQAAVWSKIVPADRILADI
jgi:hypothetical protein